MTTTDSTQTQALGINEIQINKFYSRGLRKNDKHKNIVFVIEIDLKTQLVTAILVEDMFTYINDINKQLHLAYTRPFGDFKFYPLDGEAKKYAEKERDSFIRITEKGISLRQEEIKKLETQKLMLQNSI